MEVVVDLLVEIQGATEALETLLNTLPQHKKERSVQQRSHLRAAKGPKSS